MGDNRLNIGEDVQMPDYSTLPVVSKEGVIC